MQPATQGFASLAHSSRAGEDAELNEVQSEMSRPPGDLVSTTQELVLNKGSNTSEGRDKGATCANAGKLPDTLTTNLQISKNNNNVNADDSNVSSGRPLDSHVSEETLDKRSDEKIRELRAHAAEMYSRFEHSRTIEDINEAITHWKAVISLTTISHPDRPDTLSDVGRAYLSRYENLGELPDLDAAIDYNAQAVSLTPDSDKSKPARLSNLGIPYAIRFERLGELVDLNKAIDCGARAVLLASDGDSSQLVQLSNLGASYRARFLCLGEPLDLDRAIECGEKSVSLTSDDDTAMPGRLSNLGSSYQARFSRSGELTDLTKAIECGVRAVSLIPLDHTDRPRVVNNLGSSYRSRFSRLGDPLDMDKAIECGDQAVLLTPDDHPDMPGRLHNLGIWYATRFGRLGKLSDLDKAIESGARAVSLTPDGHANKPGRLNSLGNSYRYRFGRLSELADLNKAIDCGAHAIALTPAGHTSEPGQLSNLGILYRIRFDRLGELQDLSQAIGCGAKAVSLTPDGHPDKPERLSSLGNTFRTRFRRLGELPDLNMAIEYGAQAVALTPKDHSDRSGELSNLGTSYRARFQRLGELTDLNKAIDCGAQAVLLTPKDHSDRPRSLSNLGNSYLMRFERLADQADLNKAIECGEEAISMTPDTHTDKSSILSNLGNLYLSRFGQFKDPLDLSRGMDYATWALSLVPDGHAGRATSLHGLASAYKARFRHLTQLRDLDEAIQLGSQAALLLDNSDVARPSVSCFLGDVYNSRFDHMHSPSDLENAIKYLKDAAQSSVGSPFQRFKSCRKWARLGTHHAKSSYLAYQRAMDLLPQLVWIGTTLDQRYNMTQEVGDLATEAASYAISIGNYELALEWLEAGRSIVWGQITQLRTPFDELFTYDSELANKLKEVGRKLEYGVQPSFISSFENDASYFGGDVGRNAQLALDWDTYVSQARSIPGFQDFLKFPKASQLISAARSQPVAVINVHESRCDALILQPDSNVIGHVPLTDFSVQNALAAREHLAALGRSRKIGRLSNLGSAEKSLAELWFGVAKPILDFLDYTTKPSIDHELPRLTWCTTGLLSFLPLHAAGCDDISQLNVFELVVSSYTPTLSALIKKHSVHPESHHGLLAVGLAHTPGLDELPGTKDELIAIQAHAPEGYLGLENKEATVHRVLDALDRFSWVHMACHGSQDTIDPTQSAFHLHDGPLTLAAIAKRSFKNKGLAFLSACQTATGDKRMPEEAIHLAAGMLLAGYPSVIGTMWSIEDSDGPVVADGVYAELLKDGNMDHTKSARALHQAVSHLREKVGVKAIGRWAPFIHIGA